jgi:molecular chaperone GrpE
MQDGSAPEPFTPETAEGDAEELELLRSELARAQGELSALRGQLQEAQDRHLRARADLETVRRRAQQDLERAREAGQDSAVLTVLSVFDDLNRALAVADEADPGKIVPGVRAVLSSLERNLGSLGLTRSGEVGEPFNPEVHEALTTLPAPSPERSGTIAEVFEAGFTKGERLVRPARVVVYQ